MEKTIQCQKTFRYHTLGNSTEAKFLLYVLHGYGHLAEYFIQKFKEIDPDFYVVAPEGMHRFYLSGTSGRVGASWMTKEARETDIYDNLNWLNSLDEKISQEKIFQKKIILGFSQGGATAARWANNGQINADHVIYWASVFPPDLEITLNDEAESNKNNHFVVGDQDQYFNDDQQKEILHYYSKKGYNTHHYNGNHSIEPTVLSEILAIVKKKGKLDEK